MERRRCSGTQERAQRGGTGDRRYRSLGVGGLVVVAVLAGAGMLTLRLELPLLFFLVMTLAILVMPLVVAVLLCMSIQHARGRGSRNGIGDALCELAPVSLDIHLSKDDREWMLQKFSSEERTDGLLLMMRLWAVWAGEARPHCPQARAGRRRR